MVVIVAVFVSMVMVVVFILMVMVVVAAVFLTVVVIRHYALIEILGSVYRHAGTRAVRRIRQSEHRVWIRKHRGRASNQLDLLVALGRVFEADDVGKRSVQRYSYRLALNHDTQLNDAMHVLRARSLRSGSRQRARAARAWRH